MPCVLCPGRPPQCTHRHAALRFQKEKRKFNYIKDLDDDCLGAPVSQTSTDFVFYVGVRDRAQSEVYSSAAHGRILRYPALLPKLLVMGLQRP